MQLGKTISFTPNIDLEKRIESLKNKTRLSKGALSELALEFATDLIKKGQAAVTNGKIELVGSQKEVAHA